MLRYVLSAAILQLRSSDEPFANFGLPVVFSQIDTQIFSRWQFLFGRVGKTFIWINTKCLKIEIKNQVATIPNGGVFFGSYYPPRPLRHHKHSQVERKVYQPMTCGALRMFPQGGASSTFSSGQIPNRKFRIRRGSAHE
jgi:hypothetical protein